MAAVEKLSFSPLIDHFKEENEFYERLLVEYELQNGIIDGSAVLFWMRTVVEPAACAVFAMNAESVSRVCKAFFMEILLALSRGWLIVHAGEFEKLWLALIDVPELLSKQPAEMLRAVRAAFFKLKQLPEIRIDRWIDLFSGHVSWCEDFEQLKAMGRVCAWGVGMAHLRKRAKDGFDVLTPALQKSLSETIMGGKQISGALSRPWVLKERNTPHMLGGFAGFPEGVFVSTPGVAKIDDEVFATDGLSVFGVFADVCGTVLVPCKGIAVERIVESFEFHQYEPLAEKAIAVFDDINSLCVCGETVLFTRSSSYCVYVFTPK